MTETHITEELLQEQPMTMVILLNPTMLLPELTMLRTTERMEPTRDMMLKILVNQLTEAKKATATTKDTEEAKRLPTTTSTASWTSSAAVFKRLFKSL